MSIQHVSDLFFDGNTSSDEALSARQMRVSRAMAAADSMDALLGAFASPAQQAEPCNAALMWATGEVNGGGMWLELLAQARMPGHDAGSSQGCRVRGIAVDRTFLESTADVLIVPDLADQGELIEPSLLDVVRDYDTGALAVIPLSLPGHSPAGAAIFMWDKPYAPPLGWKRLYALLAPELAALVDDRIGSAEVRTAHATGHLSEQGEDESETRFRQVFEESPLGMALTDVEGNILRVNRTLCQMLGYTEDELTELSVARITHPDDRDLDAHWAQAVRAGRLASYQIEKRYITHTGETIWVEVTSTLVRQDGDHDYGLRMVQDITERKWVESAEREQRILADALRKNLGTISSTLELDDVLDRILESMEQVVPHDAADIMFVDRGEAFFARVRGYTQRGLDDWARRVRLVVDRTSTLREMTQSKEPVCVVDTYSHDGWVTLPETAWVRSHVGAPILIRDEVIGFLHANSAEPAAYSPDDAERLQAFADQAAIAIKNARLYESERRQLQLAETLQEVGALLTSEMNLEEVLSQILDLLARVVAYDSVSLQLVDEGRQFTLMVGRGFPDMREAEHIVTQVLPPVLGERWSDPVQNVMVIPDTLNDERWIPHPKHDYIRSWIGVALRVKGRLIGLLNVDSATPYAYDEETANTVLAFANQAAIAIENARLFDESQQRNERLEVLNEITHIGATTLDLDRLVDAIAAAAPRIIGADRCYISLWNPNAGQPGADTPAARPPEAAYGNMPGTQSLSDLALSRGDTVLIPDVSQATMLSRRLRSLVRDTLSANALLILPLLAGEQWLGAMTLACAEPREFSDEDVAWAEQVAEATALAAAKAQAYAGLEERVAQRTAELMAANRRLVRLSRTKDEFVSNVSHELRTPIASLKLYHHLLTARPDKRDVYLERLARETDRLEMIVENLLYLSRMDQEQFQLEWARLDLGRLVEVLITDREPLAARQGLILEHYVEPNLPPVRGDEMAVGQAISVLLTNALSYTPEGGTVRVGVWLDEQVDGRWIAIGVSDNGPGIQEDERDRLFERFFRGQAGRDSGVPGTGLGLAIAREIVERHEGRIELEDTHPPEGGTTFIIRLPPID
jgi:PAS domain S-box-containing protein